MWKDAVFDLFYDDDPAKALALFQKNGVQELFRANGLEIVRINDRFDGRPLGIRSLEENGCKLRLDNVDNDLLKSVSKAMDNLSRAHGLYFWNSSPDVVDEEYHVFSAVVFGRLRDVHDTLVKSKELEESLPVIGKDGESFPPGSRIVGPVEVPVKDISVGIHSDSYGPLGGISVVGKDGQEYGTDIDTLDDALGFLGKGTYEYPKDGDGRSVNDIRFVVDKDTGFAYSKENAEGEKSVSFRFGDLAEKRKDEAFIKELDACGLGKVLDFADDALRPEGKDVVEITDIAVGIDGNGFRSVNFYPRDDGAFPYGFLGDILGKGDGKDDGPDCGLAKMMDGSFDLYRENPDAVGPAYAGSVRIRFSRGATLGLDFFSGNDGVMKGVTVPLDFLKNPKSGFGKEIGELVGMMREDGMDARDEKFFVSALGSVVDKYRKDNGLEPLKGLSDGKMRSGLKRPSNVNGAVLDGNTR